MTAVTMTDLSPATPRFAALRGGVAYALTVIRHLAENPRRPSASR